VPRRPTAQAPSTATLTSAVPVTSRQRSKFFRTCRTRPMLSEEETTARRPLPIYCTGY
jgi:hypothetical protein